MATQNYEMTYIDTAGQQEKNCKFYVWDSLGIHHVQWI